MLISQKLRNSNNKNITYIDVDIIKKNCVSRKKRYTKFEYKNLNSAKI